MPSISAGGEASGGDEGGWGVAVRRSALFLVMLAVTVLWNGCSRPSEGPLSFTIPVGWKVEYKDSAGTHFYSLVTDAPENEILMVSKWPPPNTPQEIPSLVEKLADGFLSEVKKSPELKVLAPDYHVEHFIGSQSEGSYAVFEIDNGGTNTCQSMFMLNVGNVVWHGQFTGPRSTWGQALAILKTVKSSD